MKLRKFILGLVGLFAILLAVPTTAQKSKTASKNSGDATYYGHKFHGRRTSDGSIYHRDSLTCAHRTYPFGTMLRVRNKKNGREVIVKVTDRGPFRRGGVIDLSYAAAKEIDMVAAGVVPVEIEPVTTQTMIAHVPNKIEKQEAKMPELRFLDPTDGKYYTMTDWLARDKARQDAAAASRNMAKGSSKFNNPTWHAVPDKLTAGAKKKQQTNKD